MKFGWVGGLLAETPGLVVRKSSPKMDFIMKNSFRSFSLNFPPCITATLRFAVISTLVAFCFLPTQAQESQPFQCTVNEYKFTGPAAQTLCEEFSGFICDIQIGAGTPFPKSSLLVTPLLSGHICIIGDFEVDNQFRFENAVVKIEPGVAISIKGSQTIAETGSLVLDNSKLFACNGLWKGIKLGFLSKISTYNHVEMGAFQIVVQAAFAAGAG